MRLRGEIDRVTRDRISGWARDADLPDQPVSLLITVNDQLLHRVLADRPRDDLRIAGIGDGRHSFDVTLRGLSPLERHAFAVRRETDGAHLPGSPIVVQPSARFDAPFQEYCARLLADTADEAELDDRLEFLADQAEILLRRRSGQRARHADRVALRQVKWRWTGPDTVPRPEGLPPRALFIDENVPVVTRDAGSNALLSHMRSLQRLGFEVTFAAADMAQDSCGILEDSGIGCCHAPWHGSVEEVLRREADCFDLVYLHRATIASRYLPLVRVHQPKARIVFSVADLHYLRYARQAKIEDRPELLALARQFQTIELGAAAAVNAVVTHSSFEAALLREQLPGVPVHVIPWAVPTRPTEVPFSRRGDLAFIGHYGHAPNLDAAHWLIDEIMPKLHGSHPAIKCLLAGSDLPDVLRRGGPCIEPVGRVDSLADVFDRVRLTVAPMAYGAGIKGKVLESMAAGVPCVCTPVAAEGLDFPAPLQALVATDPDMFVALMARLHEDEGFNAATREAGLRYAARSLSEDRIDALMREVVALPAVWTEGRLAK